MKRKYHASYEDRNGNMVSFAVFNAYSLDEAKRMAQTHKRHTPEIKAAKGVKVTVKWIKG